MQIVNGASTAGYGVKGNAVTVPYAQFVTIDPANDRLYVGAYTQAYVFNRASLLSAGTVAPAALVLGVPAGTSVGGFACP